MRSRAEERKEKKSADAALFFAVFSLFGFLGRNEDWGGLNAALNSSGVLKQGKRENTNKCYN